MVPDAIHPQVLSLVTVQWDLAWATLHLSTVKMPARSNSYSPVPPERSEANLSTMVSPKQPMLPTFPMFRNLQQYLWGAFQRVLWVAKELLSSTRVLLFLCSGYRANAAMKCEAEKIIMGQGGVEGEKVAEMRPDQTLASMLKTQVEEETEVLKRRTVKLEVEVEEEEEEERETEAEDMEFTDEEEDEESDSDWMEGGSEVEEEDDDVEDDKDALHQQTIPTTSSCVVISVSLNSKQANEEEKEGKGDEEDSEWSEEEEEDDDSEASAESVEIWESFLQRDDPYNPLSFSSWMTSRTSSNTHNSPAQESAENTHTSPVNGESRADNWGEKEEEKEEKKREDRQHSTHNIQQKKVHFSDEVTVCPLVDWPQASSNARDGSCWMAMARDRDRFRKRVEDAGKVIGLCLSPEHRRLVWEKLQKQSAL